jgi:outer membrane protein OmpA-like peptidoglycan-associated protein
MKTCPLVLVLILTISCCFTIRAQQIHYVVIGAFAQQENANRFSAHAREDLKLDAQVMFNPDRQFYYVHVLQTPDKEKAVSQTLRVRESAKITDTWVYHTGSPEAKSEANNTVAISEPEPVIKDTAELIKPPVIIEPEAGTGKFIFNIFRAMDNTLLEGEVDVINPEKSVKIGTAKGNAPVLVKLPKNKTNQVSFICTSFGYRKMQKDIDYSNPAGEGVSVDDEKNIVIDFDMVRLMKGDIAVMYNVLFFKDAAIMRPESQYEVNSLLQMMKDKPSCRIKIHGHTNGSAAGRIITMGETKSFFSLTGSKNGTGSATKLSEERANVIRDYLVENGIATDRMEIQAWGGKRNIHDKNSVRAQENVRVEIEMLED